MDYTQYLKEIIEKHYKSIRSFAQKIGIPESTLRTTLNKENGIYTMTLNNVFKICRGLGISVDSLDPFKKSEYTIEDVKRFNKYINLNEYHKDTVEILIDRLIEYEEKENQQIKIAAYQPNNQYTKFLKIEENEEELLEEELDPGFLKAASGGENVDKETMEENFKLAREITRKHKKEKQEKENK